jgi:ABC-type glycerol-3-phosphate transport system substrate-binding protein
MKTDVSRRDFLRKSAAVGAAAGLASAVPGSALFTRKVFAAPDGASGGTLKVYSAQVINKGKDFNRAFGLWTKKTGWSVDCTQFDSAKYVALFAAALTSGEQIDVMLLNGQDVRRYATNGILEPVGNLKTSQILPSALAPFRIGGKLWSIPLGTLSGASMQTNAYWLNKINMPYPSNLSDMQKVSAALKKQGVTLFVHQGGYKYHWPIWFFILFDQTSANRSVALTSQMLTGKLSFTDSRVVEALSLLQEFQQQGFFSPDTGSLQYAGAEGDWLAGRAMCWMGWNSYDLLQPPNKPPKNLSLQMNLLPRVVSDPSVKPQYPGATTPSGSIYAQSRNKAMAADLLNFLSSDPTEQIITTDLQASGNPNIRVHGDPLAVKYGVSRLLPELVVYLDWLWPPEVTAVFQDGMQGIFTGSSTPKQVAQNAQNALEAKFKQGWKFIA